MKRRIDQLWLLERLRYISALVTLAKAGGAYLIPHPSIASFKVRPLYPAAPWNWGDVIPDFVLPSASVSRESIAWSDKPNYNRVFVSGQEQGVLGQVTRQGTAGDWLAPMVTDSLITTAAAARQRGLAVLSDTGRQLDIGLRLPVLPATGIIQPGAYIQYQEFGDETGGGGIHTRLGLVRSTVSAPATTVDQCAVSPTKSVTRRFQGSSASTASALLAAGKSRSTRRSQV